MAPPHKRALPFSIHITTRTRLLQGFTRKARYVCNRNIRNNHNVSQRHRIDRTQNGPPMDPLRRSNDSRRNLEIKFTESSRGAVRPVLQVTYSRQAGLTPNNGHKRSSALLYGLQIYIDDFRSMVNQVDILLIWYFDVSLLFIVCLNNIWLMFIDVIFKLMYRWLQHYGQP